MTRDNVLGRQQTQAGKLVRPPRSKLAPAFSERWLGLVSDPDFIRVSRIAQEPSFFRIVGRAHFERWHSAFLAWLLDPAGTHLTRTFALQRLLLAAQRAGECAGSASGQRQELAMAEVIDAEVSPNEFSPIERSVNGIGRFDVFSRGNCKLLSGEIRRFNVLVEIKIDSPLDADQAERYVEWLSSAHPGDLNLAIYLSCNAEASRQMDRHQRWAHISFQDLHDLVLVPTSEHPGLNPLARTLLSEYVKNLRHANGGIRMALTTEQRQIVLGLYERHSATFDELVEVLIAEGVVGTPDMRLAGLVGRARGKIFIRADETVIEGETIRGLFAEVLKALVDRRWIDRLPLPWGDTASRHLLTNAEIAQHPSGRRFFYPVEYSGYTMESHYSRERGLRALKALFEALGVRFESIPTRPSRR